MGRFDAGQIRTAGEDLQKVAEGLDDDLDAFLDRTKEIGEPCGDAEPIGMLLGVSYGAAEEVLIEALESVVTGLETFADQLAFVASGDELTEERNRTKSQTVGV